MPTAPAVSSAVPDAFTVTSPALVGSPDCNRDAPATCGIFPAENTSYMGAANISPQLDWVNVPPGTASFAVKFTDMTYGQPHWAIWNIPGDAVSLPAGIAQDSTMPPVPAGASQSNATFATGEGYLGPQSPCNVYEFVVYALSVPTFTPTKPEFVALVGDELEALGPSVLGRATLSGRNYVEGECE